MLIVVLLAATLFGYAVGMIVGLKVQLLGTRPHPQLAPERPRPQLAPERPPVELSETKIEHPAAIHSGVHRLHTFIKPY